MARRVAPLILTAFCLAGCGQSDDPGDGGSGQAADVLAAQQSTDHGGAASGQAVYQAYCASCHDSGARDAPVTGNPADWENRSGLWQAVLAEHAKAGYLEMPARGGDSALSDLAVSQAVEYMLLTTYPQKEPD